MADYIHLRDLNAPALKKFDERALKIFQLEGGNTWIDAVSSSQDGCSKSVADNTPEMKNGWLCNHTHTIQHRDDLIMLRNHPQVAFFIRFTRNSNSRLSPSRDLFDGLMETFSINPRFQEFVMSFGLKFQEHDFAPPSLRFRNLLSASTQDHSKQGFECAYGLRYVADNGNLDGKERWSVRQFAVYQRVDPAINQSIWIFVGISKTSGPEQHVLDFLSRSSGITTRTHPFCLHLALIAASLSEWRWYIDDLTERVQSQSDRITLADVAKDKIDGRPDFNINFSDRQRLKNLEDSILNLQIMLGSTISTASSLIRHLSSLCEQPLDSTESILLNGFVETRDETNLFLTKAKILHQRVRGASSLLSGLLDYENAYSLRILAEESRQDNIAMRALTEKATKDSGAIKIITIITVFFLPATVVSSFFSTQFVSISTHDLVISSKWWIYFAVTGPLTILTLLVWYVTSSSRFHNAALYRLRKSGLIRNLIIKTPRKDPEQAEGISYPSTHSFGSSNFESQIQPSEAAHAELLGTPYSRKGVSNG